MKKILAAVFALLILFAVYTAWKFFGPATYFEGKTKFLYIPSRNATKEHVLELLQQDSMVHSPFFFAWIADRMGYWKKIKPGKYKIGSGNSVFTTVRLLRNGTQTPVNLVITKLRTREDLASLAGRRLECDSAALIRFLNNPDSLKPYGLDTNTVMTAVFPNTYTYFWNTTPGKVFGKFLRQYNAYWTEERTGLAKAKGLTPQTAYILASIVEEETNKNTDKGNITSVYLNRLNKGMKLGADPTVKFALRDFGLRRIYYKHLAVESPYNTYKVAGLPPGPICTPTTTTLDAVLHAPQTDYLYFVAKSDFSGYHVFANTYPEHMKYAKEYQDSLNRYLQRRLPAKDNLSQ